MSMIEVARVADVAMARRALERANPTWWGDLDEVRQEVLAELAADVDALGVDQLDRIIRHVLKGDNARASATMLMSDWAEYAGQRAWRLAQAMKTGVANTETMKS